MAWDIGADQYDAGAPPDTELVVQDMAHAHAMDNLVLPNWSESEATFGNESVGATEYNYSGDVVGSLFTLSTAMRVTSISAYVGRSPAWDIGADQYTGNTVGDVEFAIYDSAGNRLGYTAPTALGPYDWVKLDLLAPVNLDPGDYILCTNSDDPDGYTRYDATGGTGKVVTQEFGTWPASLVFSADGTKNYSIFATGNPISEDTLLVVQDVAHAHTLANVAISPFIAGPVMGNYLKAGSLSVSLGGAGMSPNPIAGTWAADIASPSGLFHPLSPTSKYADYFRIGREVRISLGANYDGTDYWWTRLVGYMDAPRYDHGTHTIALRGMDYAKRLADTHLRFPNNYWGASVAFDSKASFTETGSQLYALGDALDPVTQTDDIDASWVPKDAASLFVSVDDGGGVYYGKYSEDDGGSGWVELQSVGGTLTAESRYVFKIKYRTPLGGNFTFRLTQTVSGSADTLSEWTAQSTAGFVEEVRNITARASGVLKLFIIGDGLGTAYMEVDWVSLKAGLTTWNSYLLPEDCNGPYWVTLDDEPLYQGDKVNRDDGTGGGWNYDESARKLYFDEEKTVEAGDQNLIVYYYTTQTLEHVVADILVTALGYAGQAAALAAMDYTATEVTIDRVWFDTGTPALAAIRMLCERVNYRFWFDPEGRPHFQPAPVAGTPVFDFSEAGHIQSPSDYQDVEEVRNRVVIEGIEQGMYALREDKQKGRLAGEAHDQDSIDEYLERTLTITNHLFQDQASIDAMCAAVLAERKDPKWYSSITLPFNPVPLELGDTISWRVELSPPSTPEFSPTLAAWPYRKRIALPIPDADLEDFPNCIKINADAEIGAHCLATGYDIRFTAVDGVTELPYERESFAVSSGEATGVFWVKSDVSTAGTYIWVYFGNASATDGQDAEAVWDSNFKAVYHMKDATTSTIPDSTANGNDGTKKGANEPIEADGKIGKGQDFDGTDDKITIPYSAGWNSAYWSVSLWVKSDVKDENYRRIFQGLGGNKWESLKWNDDDIWLSKTNADGTASYAIIPAASWDAGTWHHIAWTFGDDLYLRHYLDGSPITPVNTAKESFNAISGDSIVGMSVPGAQPWDGSLDEIRASSVVRSAAWIKFEYYNMNEADGGLTWGSIENRASLQLTGIIRDIKLDGATATYRCELVP